MGLFRKKPAARVVRRSDAVEEFDIVKQRYQRTECPLSGIFPIIDLLSCARFPTGPACIGGHAATFHSIPDLLIQL